MLSPIHSSTADLDAQALGQRTVTIAEAEAISKTATCYLQREPSPLLKQNEMEDLDLKGIDINFDEVMMETGLHGPLIQDLDDFKPDSSDSLNSPPQISLLAPYSSHLPSQGEKQLSHLPSVPGKAGRGKKKMLSLKCRVIRRCVLVNVASQPFRLEGKARAAHRLDRPQDKILALGPHPEKQGEGRGPG